MSNNQRGKLQGQLLESQYMQFDPTAIENVAKRAIYETNNEIKKQAEYQFEVFLLGLPLELYEHLLQHQNSVVSLATAATLNNCFHKLIQLPAYLNTINNVVRRWFREDGKFIRQNGRELEDYCTNTFLFLIGKFLKEMYRTKGMDKFIMEWLMMSEQGDKYRLFLFQTFIQTVSLIESGIGFVEYKVLLSSFQSDVIPNIFGGLYPYLINFSYDIEIVGLTMMQQNMSLNNQRDNKEGSSTKTLNRFNLCIFKLLNQIVQFKYDINFKQFDQNNQILQTICFPQCIINQIIKKDFIQSLYTIINRLVQIDDIKYFNQCLECLSKILAAKITYIKDTLKVKFISTNLRGLAQMFENIINRRVNNTKIWLKVLQCSDKFLDFFDQCTKDDLVKLDQREQECFKVWVHHIFNLPLLIMSSGQAINAENQLFQLSAEVMGRMGNELVLQRINRNVGNIETYYQNFIEYFFRSCLMNNVKIMGQTTFNSLQQFKKTTIFFLQKVAMTCSSCYFLLFTELNKLLINCCNDFTHNELNISNILLFFTAMIESCDFFQRNIFQIILFQEVKGSDSNYTYRYPQQITALGQLFNNTFQFIKYYYEQINLASKSINIALTLFYQSLLTKIVNNTGSFTQMEEVAINNEPLKIKNNLFTVIKARMNVNQNQFLLSGLKGISKLIKYSEITCIQFIFSCLYRLISKLKHKFLTQNFKHTDIYKEMLALFMGLVKQKLSPHLMKWRVLLFKIISLLCYDDLLDDFRGNLRTVLDLIKSSSLEDMDRVLYDLTGICDGIESQQIFNYFLTKLCSSINYNDLLQNIYLKCSTQQYYLKDILHLTYLLMKNKQTNQENKIAHITYILLHSNFPFWSKMIQTFGNNQQKIQIFEQLYLIFKTIIADGHINLSLADQEIPKQTRLYLKLMLDHLIYFLDHVQNYPDMVKIYCQTVENTLINLKKFIFNHPDLQLPNKMTLLINKLMQKFVTGFQSVINQSNNQTIFSMLLNFFEKYFEFLAQSKTKLHTILYKQYLPTLLTLTELKQNFLAIAFMLGIHFGARKDTHTVLLITTVTHSAISCFQFDLNKMISRIGLTDHKDKLEFARIIDNIRRNLEQWSNLQLKGWFTDNLRCGKVINPNQEDGY